MPAVVKDDDVSHGRLLVVPVLRESEEVVVFVGVVSGWKVKVNDSPL